MEQDSMRRPFIYQTNAGIAVILILLGILFMPSLRSGSLRAQTLPRFTVRDFGAQGNGVTDDTDAIQATINAAPNGGAIIYFPAGSYLVSTRQVFGFQVHTRTSLRFEGAGPASSIIKRGNIFPDSRLATIAGSSDIVMTNLSFDANGIVRYGGVVFYDVQRVRIENTRFFDSQPRPRTCCDQNAYVLVGGDDFHLLNNRIEDLLVSINHGRRVRIEGNTSVHSPAVGFGNWAVKSGGILEDYVVTRNTIIDTQYGPGITFLIDHPSYTDAAFRRLQITDNRIVMRAQAGPAISIGTSNTSVPSSGHVFEDITLERNIVEVDPAAPGLGQQPMISFQSSPRAGFNFQRVTVRNNHVLGNGKEIYWMMDARRLHNSVIEGNVFRGARGIAVFSNILNTQMLGNTVGTSGIAYYFGESNQAGGNRFQRNHYFGNPATPLQAVNTAPSDVVEPPTRVSEPPPSPNRRP